MDVCCCWRGPADVGGGISIDRARGGADGEHRPEDEFPLDCRADGARALQVPCEVFFEDEDCEGRFLFLCYWNNYYCVTAKPSLSPGGWLKLLLLDRQVRSALPQRPCPARAHVPL